MVFKTIFVAQTLILNAEVASNYKCIFWVRIGDYTLSVKHQSTTHIDKKQCDETKQRVQWRAEARTQKHKQDHVLIVRHCPSETDCGGSCHLV